jgi:hypothetical protein
MSKMIVSREGVNTRTGAWEERSTVKLNKNKENHQSV